MIIKQTENGNIVLTDVAQEVHHVLPMAYLHKHPRLPDNAILINSNTDYKNELSGISILASKVRKINNQSFNGDAYQLLEALSKNITLTGATNNNTVENDIPKTKEQDPNYIKFLQANTYEKLVSFAKEHRRNIGGEKYQNGKLYEQEFLCQFQSFIIRVHLTYYYKKSNPQLVDYILLWGSTLYVFKPIKRYIYNTKNEITNYKYEEVNL